MPPVLAAGAAVLAEVSSDIAIAASFVAPGMVTAAGVQSVLTASLLSTAVGALSNGMRGSSGGVQFKEERNPLSTRRIIWGKAWTPGAGLPEMTWGASNKNLEKIIILADHECDGFEQIYVDGYPASLGTYDSVKGYPILYTSDPLTGKIVKDFRVGKQKFWIMFHWGADDQTADQWLINNSVPGWSSTKVGKNICYARVSAYYDSDIFSGLPSFNFFIRGIKLYDPTKDSTVGGSGSHRWGEPSTYEWTANRAIHAYNAARGVYIGGKRFYGSFYETQDVPLDLAMAAILACEESVALKAGGYEARYHGGLEWDVTRPVRDFYKVCAEGMAGHIATRGRVAIYAGVSQTPIFTFTDSDCVRGADQQYQPYQSFGSLKNTVTAKFLDVAHSFSNVDAPPRASNDDIADDGGIPLVDSLNLDHVQSGPTCQRIMEIMRKRHRAQANCVRTFFPSALNAREGQWIAGASSAWSGTKWFQIEHVKVDRQFKTVRMELREVPADLDDWTPANDELDGYSVNLPSGAPPDPLALTGIHAESLSQIGEDGSHTPGFKVIFDPVDDPAADTIWVRWRILGDTVEHMLPVPVKQALSGEIPVGGLAGGTTYQYCLLITGIPGRSDAGWSDWYSITTPVGKAGDNTVNYSALSNELASFQDFVGGQLTTSIADLKKLSQFVAEIGLSGAQDVHTLRQTVSSNLATATAATKAYADQQITAATGPGSAIAQNLLVLNAQLVGLPQTSGSVSAAISDASTAYVGPLSTESGARTSGDATNASAIGAVSTRVTTIEANYVTSSGLTSAISPLATSASVSDEATARASADGALSGRITTIESSYVTSSGLSSAIAPLATSASVTSEAATRASADGALSGRITTIEADYTTSGTLASALASYATTAYVSGNYATVGSVTSLQSIIGNNSSSALLKVDTYSASSGAAATAGMTLTASDGSHTATCGWKGSAVVTGGVTSSLLELFADDIDLKGRVKTTDMAAHAATTLSALGQTISTAFSGPDVVSTLSLPGRLINQIYYDDNTGNGHDIDSSSSTLVIFAGAIVSKTSHDFSVEVAVQAYNGSAWVTMAPSFPMSFVYSSWADMIRLDAPIKAFSTGSWFNIPVVVPPGYTKVRGIINGNCSDGSQSMGISDPCAFIIFQSHR